MSERGGYIGRFAPSPTGPLHAGSLVAALASWLDARAHAGRWLVRIEDVDSPRCEPGVDQTILRQLAACGLLPDETPVYQSRRNAFYQSALDQLVVKRLAYPCGCTRQDIALALAAKGQTRQRHAELIYPGTCRASLKGRTLRSWRFLAINNEQKQASDQSIQTREATESIALKVAVDGLNDGPLAWHDRLLGAQTQHISRDVGDFVLKRADGLWAYQLAVVVDDAAQGITDIVRGQDLADSSARQILLQRALGLPLPRYLHTPLVWAANGEKLSKQNAAPALDSSQPLAALQQAGEQLGLPHWTRQTGANSPAEWLQQAVPVWASLHLKPGH